MNAKSWVLSELLTSFLHEFVLTCASFILLSILSISKLALVMTSKSKFKKGVSVYNLDRSFYDHAWYLLKMTKNACVGIQFYQSMQKHIGIDKVSSKGNSYISLWLLEKLSTAIFPPPLFVIPEVSIFTAKVIFCKQCLTGSWDLLWRNFAISLLYLR